MLNSLKNTIDTQAHNAQIAYSVDPKKLTKLLVVSFDGVSFEYTVDSSRSLNNGKEVVSLTNLRHNGEAVSEAVIAELNKVLPIINDKQQANKYPVTYTIS